jgi:2-phospho-L-lactate guanylyltransferase
VVVAHGDLAHPSGLGSAEFGEGVTIVPDRHGDGTNVLAVPTDGAFDYAYGQGSAARHAQEAARRGWSVTWWRDSPWGLDVDTPDDLDAATT